jgi:hypothetical protein
LHNSHYVGFYSIAKLLSGIGAIFVGSIAVLVWLWRKKKKGTTHNEAASKPLLVLFTSTVGSCNMIARGNHGLE